MEKKSIEPKRQVGKPDGDAVVGAPRRIDRLAEVVDRCTEAKQLAEALGEKLLCYLLAMAIQETRAAMRQEIAAAAGTVKAAPRRLAKPKRLPD